MMDTRNVFINNYHKKRSYKSEITQCHYINEISGSVIEKYINKYYSNTYKVHEFIEGPKVDPSSPVSELLLRKNDLLAIFYTAIFVFAEFHISYRLSVDWTKSMSTIDGPANWPDVKIFDLSDPEYLMKAGMR